MSKSGMNLACKLRLNHIKGNFVPQKSRSFLEIILEPDGVSGEILYFHQNVINVMKKDLFILSLRAEKN